MTDASSDVERFLNYANTMYDLAFEKARGNPEKTAAFFGKLVSPFHYWVENGKEENIRPTEKQLAFMDRLGIKWTNETTKEEASKLIDAKIKESDRR